MSGGEQLIPPVITRAKLGQPGKTVARDSGESVGIYRLSGDLARSGLLFKEYKKTSVQNTRAAALEQLIAFGRANGAAGKAERAVLLAATSWPVSKVTDERGELIGCLIPEADKKFRSDTGQLREIDTLAQTDERLAARGISVSADERLAICRGIVQVAAALERRGLVYSDWNYANALWCPADCSVFVIDIDGCRPGQGPNIFQNDWEDPLTGDGRPSDTYTDRYRVALLTARCLTGQREVPNVLHSLNDAADDAMPGRATLLDMLWAADRSARPSSRILRAALDGANVRFPVQRMPLPARVEKRAAKPTPTVKQTNLTIAPKGAARQRAAQPADKQPAKKDRGPLVMVCAMVAVLTIVLIVIIIAATH